MDRLHASMEALDSARGGRIGRPVGMHVLAWVGGIADPVRGPLQVISVGTWLATPIGRRLSVDIGLGGSRYVTSFTFEPGEAPAKPVAVAIYARASGTGAWTLVRRCPLQASSTTRCKINPLQADAIRLEFDPGSAGREVAIGPVTLDMKRIQ